MGGSREVRRCYFGRWRAGASLGCGRVLLCFFFFFFYARDGTVDNGYILLFCPLRYLPEVDATNGSAYGTFKFIYFFLSPRAPPLSSRSTFYPRGITHPPGRLPPPLLHLHLLLLLEPRLVLLPGRGHPTHRPALQLFPRPFDFLPGSLRFPRNRRRRRRRRRRSRNLGLLSSGDAIRLCPLLQLKLFGLETKLVRR